MTAIIVSVLFAASFVAAIAFRYQWSKERDLRRQVERDNRDLSRRWRYIVTNVPDFSLEFDTETGQWRVLLAGEIEGEGSSPDEAMTAALQAEERRNSLYAVVQQDDDIWMGV